MKTVLNLTRCAAVAVLSAAVLGAGRGPAPVWVEREAYLMGTVLRARVEAADRRTGFEALERVFGEVRRLESVLSSWTAESEVGRVNAAPVGSATAVSPELWRLLEEAAEWRRRTGGAFDPAVGALVDAWELRGPGRRPAPAELAAALAASGPDAVALDATRRTVARRAPSAWLDTGGFGKGAALRSAARLLREAGIGAAYLDFGGQVVAWGRPPGGGPAWEVAVAHPSRRAEAASTLLLRSGSAATSAQSERYVEVAGERLGHVLDPRTGEPVPAWGSVTVVAADPLVADVLSTALLVMGPEAGRRWAEGREEVGVLFLEERGGVVVESWNEAFQRYRNENGMYGGAR